MGRGRILTGLLLGMALTTVTAEAEVTSVNTIVSKLNPLEVVANEGGIRRSVDLQVQFALNQARLKPAGKRQLTLLAEAMNSERLKRYRFQIIGHTDASGEAA